MNDAVLKKRKIFSDFLTQAEEDAVVCRFGHDYFKGARFGSFVGGMTAGLYSWYLYRCLRKDQLIADKVAGFSSGALNPDFPRSVLRRGLRCQPFLTVSCLCLELTCAFKAVKTVLSHSRCREFALDDIGFDLLAQMAEEDYGVVSKLQAMGKEVAKECDVANVKSVNSNRSRAQGIPDPLNKLKVEPESHSVRETQWTVKQLIQKHEHLLSSVGQVSEVKRMPTFMDGVAVGLFGSIFDCFLPQHSPSAYFNMCFGITYCILFMTLYFRRTKGDPSDRWCAEAAGERVYRDLSVKSSSTYSTAASSEVFAAASDIEASLWYEEFEDRLEIDKLEEHEFQRILGLEVEDYLRTHRISRQKLQIRSDYIGKQFSFLSIHDLEFRYLKQDLENRKKTIVKDHKKCLINIQKQAMEDIKLPPLLAGSSQEIGESNFFFTSAELQNPTSHPPVLREARECHTVKAEMLRQLAIKKKLLADEPWKPQYFPSLL